MIRKGLAEFLPTSVQKSYFMLSDAERDLLNTETDLAAAVLGYKGVVLDSIVEDRLLAQASQGSEDQKLVEQLKLDKRERGQLLLQPAQKLSDKTNQRIESLEGEVEKIESQLAQHVAGLGQARRALGVSLEQVGPRAEGSSSHVALLLPAWFAKPLFFQFPPLMRRQSQPGR